jgi:hypothetical protein
MKNEQDGRQSYRVTTTTKHPDGTETTETKNEWSDHTATVLGGVGKLLGGILSAFLKAKK